MTLDILDIIDVSGNNDMYITGDIGLDSIVFTATEDVTRRTDREIDGIDYARFRGDDSGADLLVQIGLDFNGSELTAL
jgi:hypothetical protein